MTSWKVPSNLSTWFVRLAVILDKRVRPLLQMVLIGILLTTERRRTASSWFRTGGIGRDFRRAYNVIGSVGRAADTMATTVLLGVEDSPALAAEEELTFAIDDTPSKRYGPEVEGAGLHHNPTPGPSGAAFVFGHSFVTLARLASHPEHGTIALPLGAELYVRKKDIPRILRERRWEFRTKIELAVKQVDWLGFWLQDKEKPIWVVVDGAYAKRPVLKAAATNGIFLVSRLRKDAALRTLPKEQPSSKRGRKPKYGREVISLAKRAGQKGGWQTEKMVLYGEEVTKTYKTFLATWAP